MKQKLLQAAFDIRVWKIFHLMGKERLLVLNYHRINNPDDFGCPDFVPNISATPKQFAAQLDYLLARGFHFVSEREVITWVETGEPLPPFAVLVTFDDGYEDNYSNAFPILQQRDIPATIFLSTDHIGTSKPFYWDLVSYCLYHSPIKEITLPLMGNSKWEGKNQRMQVAGELVSKLKVLPEVDKTEIVLSIPELLEVEVNHADFDGKHLSWDQVREMANGLIAFGGHTKSHPILTRISLEKAFNEVKESKQTIEKELGLPVESMAYPNGGEKDFSPEIMKIVEEVGYKIAFSLIDGYTQYRNLNQNRYKLRRIYLGRKDHLPRFAAKISAITNWTK